jgi:TnpA family transposase
LVRQNYVRAGTLTCANAALVDAQNRIDLAQSWGGGDVVSADGLRFVVPIRTIQSLMRNRRRGPGPMLIRKQVRAFGPPKVL